MHMHAVNALRMRTAYLVVYVNTHDMHELHTQ